MDAKTERKYIVPKRLDDPTKFLWWDFDVAIRAMGGVLIGILINMPMTSGVVGCVVAMSYQKLKAGRSRAFGLHALYWYLPVTFGFRITPPSAVRAFIG
ncbi:MAG: type IV conjugative transfer system protein TraL [Rhodocyclaceae bacterium]|nr:type IV conjugative transfer system protein TraL [Rhodocyclaceae bacterium]